MKQIYHHYEKWEDWRDGLYRQRLEDAQELLIARAARLLANPSALEEAMLTVSLLWRHSADVNLSNLHRNRQAWLGQAACCYVCGAPEDLTKLAWHRLSAAEKIAANAVADKVIEAWEGSCQSAA